MAALGDFWHINAFFLMCGALDFQILADVVGLCRKPIADLFEHAAVFPADLVGSTVIPADLIRSAVIPADLVGSAVIPADLVGSAVIPADLVGSAVIPADLFRFLVNPADLSGAFQNDDLVF